MSIWLGLHALNDAYEAAAARKKTTHTALTATSTAPQNVRCRPSEQETTA